MKALSTTLLLIFFSTNILAQEVGYIKMKSHKKPIIQAEINGKKGYFLVDTGSDISVINSSDLKRFKLDAFKTYGNHKRAIGFDGTTKSIMKIKNAEVVFGEHYDHSQFYSLDIDNLASTIEAKTNIKIHGIMGTDLLTKYNCVIDYNQRQIVMVDNRTKRKLAAR